MEDFNEQANVVPELYYLIAKFLSGGPLKETAKTLLKELESVEVLPRRLDWQGVEHPQSFNELDSQYSEVSWRRLASVCERALHLARSTTCPPHSGTDGKLLGARLSLLSETLVRPKPKYASFKEDNTLVRRLMSRELGAGALRGCGGAGLGAVPTAPRPFPPRLLGGLTLQRRTLGHLSAVYCLAFDRTGRYVLTGADDLLVKVWSAVDGRLAATLRGAGAEITDVCASDDGALLACGSVERLVRVWCLATAAPRAVLHAHGGTITCVQWAPLAHAELRWLASTSTDGSVAFWTCSRDGQFLSQPVQYVERLRPGACHMICAAWSAGGAFLAAGSADQRVRVYALEAAGPRRVLETAAHTDAVDSLAWAHRGLRFVSGSKDGTAALWQLHATQWRHTPLRVADADEPKKLKVTMVCWDRSDAYVMTAVSDSSVRVWCARTCAQVRSLRGHRDEAYVLEAHPTLAGVFLSAGHDGQLFVWHAESEEPLARFHNVIPGQGEGALFDARWAACGTRVAASDSHGHLLLLGLGAGHPRLQRLPAELFFHTDYRPLARDALGGALDEQTELPPHLMPPPFLVDVEGAPHSPEFQRLVPGRETLPLERLVPRTRLDAMIAALAAAGEVPQHGVWRGEGVRHTAGEWQGLDVPLSTRPIVTPPAPSVKERLELESEEMNEWEMSWYRREMRRRPVMISTAPGGEGPRRRPGRRPRAAPRARPPPPRTAPTIRLEDEVPDAVEESGNDTSDESVRLSASRSSKSTRSSRSSRSSKSSHSSRSRHSSADMTDSDSSHSGSKSDSSSSQYSDWQAGSALAPPARARRRPAPAARYSPSSTTAKRSATTAASTAAAGSSGSAAGPSGELPEVYRVGEWLTAVSPRKAPYHPQMGDHCLYFRLGHQRYFEAVAEKDLYKIYPRDKPWDRVQIFDCEAVKVVGIKYVIKPPRVVSLKLLRERDARAFAVRYHDMPDVIDFLVLRHHYDAAVARRWGAGDRFRCMIDDSWWTGQVLERSSGSAAASSCSSDEAWANEAASHFLSLRVRWDNGEVERLSPWDLEPIDPERLPSEPGGAVGVLPHELEAVLARSHEWPPRACRTVAQHISQVMSLSVAEPFVAPVDLQLYPSYALVVPYPIDLATIRARFENLFYRRAAAAQFDARWLASNAERFNEPHSPIVRQARLVTDLLLHIISNWETVDVVAQYHSLAASYHSSDDEVIERKQRRTNRTRSGRAGAGRGSPGDWPAACSALLHELCASADAEPFREPVSPAQAPDYPSVVSRPMDLGTVRRRLAAGKYARAVQVAADVRLVFANSRLYNTNKRSRIYSMTVRLSSLFEALWVRLPVELYSSRPRRARRAHARTRTRVRTRTNARARTRQAAVEQQASAARASSASSAPAAHDSWDSDAPLTSHRKGKGVGKKSKSAVSASSSSRAPPDSLPATSNGLPSEAEGAARSVGDSSEHSRIEVVEEELVEDEVELEYEPPVSHQRRAAADRRKRRRPHSSASSAASANHKRVRERFSSGSWSSTSGSGSGSGSGWRSGSARRRYESDRSYRPAAYSSDDDAPLLHYRQRQAEDEGAGPSRVTHNAHRSGGVSLRRRGSPRRYNEDSEEDSVAAISKRLPHHHRHHQQQQRALDRRRRHAQNAGAAGGEGARAATSDHNYFNGHARHNGNGAHGDHHNNGTSSGSGASGASGTSRASGGPVSISSRGRVRKLTAKARGLLRH